LGWVGGCLAVLRGYGLDPEGVNLENALNLPGGEAGAVDCLPSLQIGPAERRNTEAGTSATRGEFTKHIPQRNAAGWQLGHNEGCAPGVVCRERGKVGAQGVAIGLFLVEME
jgi:hypothetical protein